MVSKLFESSIVSISTIGYRLKALWIKVGPWGTSLFPVNMPIDIAIALVLFMRQFLGETKDTSLKLFVGDYNVCCSIMFSLKKEDR